MPKVLSPEDEKLLDNLRAACTADSFIRSDFISDTYRGHIELDGVTKDWDLTRISLPLDEEKALAFQMRFGLTDKEMKTLANDLARILQNDRKVHLFVSRLKPNDDADPKDPKVRAANGLLDSIVYLNLWKPFQVVNEHGNCQELFIATEPLEPMAAADNLGRQRLKLSDAMSLCARLCATIVNMNGLGIHLGVIDLANIFRREEDNRKYLSISALLYGSCRNEKTESSVDLTGLKFVPKTADPALLAGAKPSLETDARGLARFMWLILSGQNCYEEPDMGRRPDGADQELTDILRQLNEKAGDAELRSLQKYCLNKAKLIRAGKAEEGDIQINPVNDFIQEARTELQRRREEEEARRRAEEEAAERARREAERLAAITMEAEQAEVEVVFPSQEPTPEPEPEPEPEVFDSTPAPGPAMPPPETVQEAPAQSAPQPQTPVALPPAQQVQQPGVIQQPPTGWPQYGYYGPPATTVIIPGQQFPPGYWPGYQQPTPPSAPAPAPVPEPVPAPEPEPEPEYEDEEYEPEYEEDEYDEPGYEEPEPEPEPPPAPRRQRQRSRPRQPASRQDPVPSVKPTTSVAAAAAAAAAASTPVQPRKQPARQYRDSEPEYYDEPEDPGYDEDYDDYEDDYYSEPAQRVRRTTVVTRKKKKNIFLRLLATLFLVSALLFCAACFLQYSGYDVPWDIPYIDELRGGPTLQVTPTVINLKIGETTTIMTSEASTLSSSDHGVVEVSDTGKVETRGVGTTTIVATSMYSGQTVKIPVTVTEADNPAE